MYQNSDSTMDRSNGADNPAGGQVQRPSERFFDAVQPDGDTDANPVKVMPCQVQMFTRGDKQGRRYMVLENLPTDKNYVANRINSGGEFA